jgi:hypothetical protein
MVAESVIRAVPPVACGASYFAERGRIEAKADERGRRKKKGQTHWTKHRGNNQATERKGQGNREFGTMEETGEPRTIDERIDSLLYGSMKPVDDDDASPDGAGVLLSDPTPNYDDNEDDDPAFDDDDDCDIRECVAIGHDGEAMENDDDDNDDQGGGSSLWWWMAGAVGLLSLVGMGTWAGMLFAGAAYIASVSGRP